MCILWPKKMTARAVRFPVRPSKMTHFDLVYPIREVKSTEDTFRVIPRHRRIPRVSSLAKKMPSFVLLAKG